MSAWLQVLIVLVVILVPIFAFLHWHGRKL